MSLFYEKLAAKKRDEAESVPKRFNQALRTAATAAGGNLLGRGTARGLFLGAARHVRRADEADHLRRLHAKINPRIAQIVSEESIPHLLRKSPAQHLDKQKKYLKNFISGGAAFQPDVGINPQGVIDYSRRSGKGRAVTRGMIASSLKNTDTTALMHELGHATGKLGYGKNKLYSGLVRNSVKLTRGGPGTGFGIGRAGLESYNIGAAKSKKELDAIEKRTNILTGLHGLMTAPLLFEEGRANLRAIGLGKKFGAKVSKGKLSAAMGGYLANAAGQTLLPHYLIKRRIKQRRKALADKRG